jgi:outer membrane protein OmpA-like peptidoglycan-associated protein
MPEGDYAAGVIQYGNFKAETFPLETLNRQKLIVSIDQLPKMGGNSLLEIGIEELHAMLKDKKGQTAAILLTDGQPTNAEGALAVARNLAHIQKGRLSFHPVQIGSSKNDFLLSLSTLSAGGSYHTGDALGDTESLQAFIRRIFFAPAITFDFGIAKIMTKHARALNEIAAILKHDTRRKLYIDGHSDSRGSGVSNQAASEKRAKAVKEHLVRKGIRSDRLIIRSFGDTKPIRPNDSEENQRMNRRVELEWIR